MNKLDISSLKLKEDKEKIGDESTIYEILGKDELYKEWKYIWHEYDKILSKVKKLELLEEKEEVKPYIIGGNNIILNENRYSGYTMDLYEGSVFSIYINYSDSVKLLKKIKEALKKLYDNDILYLDLNYSNILYKKENDYLDFRFIDMDNAMIDGIRMEFEPPFLAKYISCGGDFNYNALVFSLNYLTITILSRFDPRLCGELHTFSYNRKIERFSELIDKPKVDSIIDNEFLIDYYDENMLIKRM